MSGPKGSEPPFDVWLTREAGEDEVAVLRVGPHERENPDLDVYRRLYEALGVEVPDDEHRRPACCEDGQPPVDPESLERLIDRTRELTQQRRRTRPPGT